jgi:uncharacterized protein (DUF2461 family)
MPAERGETQKAGTACFGPALFRFLKELEANNNRSWFQANKHRYESQVKEPMLRFIAEFDSRLRAISQNFDADPRPAGGSMFRIYRDTRFSRDKSPYKTTAASGRTGSAEGSRPHRQPHEGVEGRRRRRSLDPGRRAQAPACRLRRGAPLH